MKDTAQATLVWLTSAAGLGVAVPFVVSFIKRYLKVEGWQALLLTFAVAMLIGGGAMIALETGVYAYFEDYWPLLVAVIGVTFGSSQLVYHKAPRTSKREQ